MPSFVIFLGAAGSGKGTQAQDLKDQVNTLHVSTGDLLRRAMSSGSELGVQAKSFVESGNLVPDDLIVNLVRETLVSENAKDRGFILDGFPRTTAQAEALDQMLADLSISLTAVVLFDLSLEDTIERIVGRRVCQSCQYVYHISEIGESIDCCQCNTKGSLIHRSDDTEEKVRHRYSVFQSQTEPLVSYYDDLLFRLDATQTPFEVNEVLKTQVFNHGSN